MDSFSCPKCSQTFTTQNWLDHHIEKNLPCDFKCRQCDFKGKDRFQYYRHQKAKHQKKQQQLVPYVPPKEKEEDDSEVLTLEPMTQQQLRQSVDLIPLEDFNWKYLVSIADNVEVTETFYDKMEHGKDKDGKDAVQRVQGYERRTILTLRAENARRSLPHTIMPNILQCLTESCDLGEMMHGLLNDVHAQRIEPRLLTIKANDINRKNVSFYSRPEPSDDCYWTTNSNSVALKKTRKHCESLFNFALVSAIDSLRPVLELSNKTRRQNTLWLMCPTKGPEGKNRAFSLKRDREDDIVLYSELLDQSDRNVITIGEITNTEHIAFLKQIRDEIEKEKESILGRLAHVELDDKRLNEFFEMAKDASVGLID